MNPCGQDLKTGIFPEYAGNRTGCSCGIVEKPLIQYRTSPVSANIKSMEKRRELMHYLVQKHFESYRSNLADVLLDMEAISGFRLSGWENEMVYSIEKDQELSESAKDFMRNPSYGDGGMAAAVRIASAWEPISLRKGNHEKCSFGNIFRLMLISWQNCSTRRFTVSMEKTTPQSNCMHGQTGKWTCRSGTARFWNITRLWRLKMTGS